MRTLLAVLLAGLAARHALAQPTPISVDVDAREAKKGVFHSHLVIPARAGPVTLTYPKWIPGEHGPSGPIQELVNLRLTAGGHGVPWRRDPVDMFAFHAVVPPGADALEADFDYLSPFGTAGSGYGNGPNATAHIAIVLWNQQVLVPKGSASDAVTYHATLRLPPGYSFDTALPVARKDAGLVDFAPVTLTRLVDSPVLAGDSFKTIPIAGGEAPVRLAVAADDAKDVNVPEASIAQLKRVVAEANALFGARHYTQYVWLVALSDVFDANGLEHPESSDDRLPGKLFSDPKMALAELRTLAHEYVHSWNGKYRRPRGLATPDYEHPMDGELLWVYEGLTRYLGDLVLTPRAGIMDAKEARDYLAWMASSLEDARPGRSWRPLADTAVAAQLLYDAPTVWSAARRGVDFYEEAGLIWLEADMRIRKDSNGTRSLDDFCKRFFGAPAGPPALVPYTLDDVLAALNAVAPGDWRGFFTARVYDVAPHAPLGGLAAAGWRLGYAAEPNLFRAARAASRKEIDWTYRIGLRLDRDGKVTDVLPLSPAFEAGVVAGSKVKGVNGATFSEDVLREVVARGDPVELLLEKDERLATLRLHPPTGAPEPHLVRVDGVPDTLAAIQAPRATP